MSRLPFHQQQLEFIIDLACNRIEFLKPFFSFLNYFDTPYFYFVLIPILWLGVSYQWGIRIFYWLTLNQSINGIVKTLIGWPRPSTDLPDIGIFHPTSHGFPSGGAQSSFFLGALLIYYWKTPTAWAIGSIYILLISFSRLYLGVHYPLDILGGWAVAALLLTLFILTKNPLEHWFTKRGPQFCLLLSLTIPILLMILTRETAIYYTMGAALGIGLGIYFSRLYHLFLPPPKTLSEGASRSFIGIAMLFLIILLLPGAAPVKSFAAGLFMSIAASPICKWFIMRN